MPSVNGLGDLRGCLAALAGERAADPARLELEVLLVERCGAVVRTAIASENPWVTIIPVDARETIPEMRKRAFETATGDMVAVIEDHVIVPPGWASRMCDALHHEDGSVRAIVGGSVSNAATDSIVDWAAFLCEYSHCLPPLQSGSVGWLTGNNVVYPRDLLLQHVDSLGQDRWENVLHDSMRDCGVRLVCYPDIGIGHKKHYTIAEYTSQRYLYARAYAGARAGREGFVRRMAYGIGALILPPVLFARVVKRVRLSGAHQRELRASRALLALFVCSWAAGEFVGAFFGGGDALERVC